MNRPQAHAPQTPAASHQTTTQNDKPSEWLQQLEQHGLLRWKHGNNNIGLLLAGLLDICGWQGNVSGLTDALPFSTERVQIKDLLGVMAALGYRIHSEKTHTRNIKAEDLPALFTPGRQTGWQAGIILKEMGPYGLIWEDGRESHRGNIPAESGTLYRFERVNSGNTADEERSLTQKSWLGGVADRFRPLLWHAMILSLLMHLFTLAVPIFSMVVYDRVISARAAETLPMLTVGVLLALGAEHMIRWMRVRLAGWIGARSSLLCTAAMLERLLFLPAMTIEQASVSAQLARIRAFEAIRDFITGPAFLSILEIPFLFVLVLAIAFLAGPVAWIAISILLLQIIMIVALRPRWKALGRKTAHAAALRQQLLMDAIKNIKPIYGAGLSERTCQRFRGVSWQAAKANYHFGLATAIMQHAGNFFTVLAGVGTIVWSLERIWAGEMTGGAMVAVMIITWRVLYPLQALCSVLPHLEQIRASLRQVTQLMAQPPEAHAAQTVLAEKELHGQVTLQNLGLRYHRKSDPVFVGLNAEIEPGEIVAVYGNNGSGKSSILRLLLGLYPAALGQIRLDGVDHRQFDPRNLRRQIGYLPQTPELLPGTIAENLRIQNPLAPDYRLRQALLWADAWESIERLPAGWNTRLGDNGISVSSGLAMRLMLSRLYLSDSHLLLCDELPSPILNSSTGQRFCRFLQECRGSRTVFYITHREEMLSLADKIIWMKPDGKPVLTRPVANSQTQQREPAR